MENRSGCGFRQLEHNAQTVDEMVSRAIVHQEDLLGLLTSKSLQEYHQNDDKNNSEVFTSFDSISPQVLRALKAKIENSMDWCQLALCRLREMAQHSMESTVCELLSSYSKAAGDPAAPKQLVSKEPSSLQWNPDNVLFTPGLPLGADSHQQQGQNFARLHMDSSEWPLLPSEASPPVLSDPRQCSSSCPENNPGTVGSVVRDHHLHYQILVAEDQSFINKPPTPLQQRGIRATRKSEVRKLSGGEAKLEVVFQKLNDSKKGIPDDGHRSWKKYGNKSIQNSNHCRGYYKCSVKECRAKKMVQPTDKDPTLFEVTYVGKHSCSSTGQRRRSSQATPAAAPAEPGKSPGLMEMEDSSNLEVSAWTGIIPDKRGRSLVEDDKASSFNYLTTSPSQDREQVGDASMDTYLGPQSSAVLSFQEPLLWHDFDMDTNLSTGHKSVSMDSDAP